MDNQRSLYIYTGELLSMELRASIAFDQLRAGALCRHPSAHLLHDRSLTILESANTISLIFFPSKANKSELSRNRAKLLRETYDVAEGSILMSRVVRNHSAHIDDRLDLWLKESKNRTFGRSMLGSQADADALGVNAKDVLGMIDPRILRYVFWGDEIDLNKLMGEIQRIARKARCLAEHLVWPGKED